MRLFLKFMLEVTRFELAAARMYSSNRAYISQLTRDVSKWEGELLKWEVSRGHQ